MATVFGNEFKTSTFSNEVNGMKLTGDLRVDSNDKIESLSGTFTNGNGFLRMNVATARLLIEDGMQRLFEGITAWMKKIE